MPALSIFDAGQKDEIVNELMTNQLMLAAQNAIPGISLPTDYVWSKLLAAEAEVSRSLRVFLRPTRMIPDDAEQPEVDALANASPSVSWMQEAAYDYDPEIFQGESWGMIPLKQKPLIAVDSIRFIYPGGSTPNFEVPPDWVRLDRKYGHIRLVPSRSAFLAPLNAWIMSVLGGGRSVPMMIQVRYTAGLKDVFNDWPDLVDVIKRKACFKIVMESYLPNSGSISADGLSQSMSIDLTKYAESIDEALFGGKGSNGGLRSAIHGVMIGVMR